MANPILDQLRKVHTVNISGGYARFQVQFEMMNKARALLTGQGDDMLPNLKRCLRDTDIGIQTSAVEICDAVPLQHKQAVIDLLHHQLKLEEMRTERNNLPLRNKIKRMLSQLGDTSIQKETKAILKSDDAEVRRQAITTLGANPQANKATLIEIFQTDDDARVRRDALSRLFTLQDDTDLIDIFASAYDDETPFIRKTAINCLMNSKVDDPRIPDLIMRAVDDDDEDVVIDTLNKLSNRNMPVMVPRLVSLISEVTDRILSVVMHALYYQIVRYKNMPDDWQPIINVVERADEFSTHNRSASRAVACLGAWEDLSIMPLFMRYMIRDATFDGNNPNDKPSFTVLNVLKSMYKNIEWFEYERALAPYMISDNLLERRATIQILLWVDKARGMPHLRSMRANETDPELIDILDSDLK